MNSGDEPTRSVRASGAGPATGSFRGEQSRLPVEDAQVVDGVCDAFEVEWRGGRRPDIAAALADVPAALRPAALKELVTLDVYYRRRAGEAPAAEDYSARFPDLDLDWLGGAVAAEATVGPLTRTANGTGTTPSDSYPDVLGYEILGELGRGGMGVVFKARQVGLKREVALKTLLRADASRVAIARFWAEAEVMAAVKHPNVVQVFELGEAAGRPFMAMEYLPGGSLADRLGASRLAARPTAALLEKVARGVAAAHGLAVVHRDLKPANVLLDATGEPKVADFGLAKGRSADLTQTHAVMGTPAYMAPEQAAGRARFVGPPADVWALGVILYEALAGRRPFDGETAQALLSQIQSAEPAALRTVASGVPRDLATITAKCLSKEPEHRYPTAAELADDLGRFLRGDPILARPAGAVERFARWVRRKPAAAAAYGFSSLAVALALVVFVVLGFWREAEGAKEQLAGEKQQTEDARREAERLRGEEERLRLVADQARGVAEQAAAREAEAREKLEVFEYGGTSRLAHQEWRESNLGSARALLDGTKLDLRGWEWRYLHRLCEGSLLTLRHAPSVVSAAFSPDGSRVVTAGADGMAKVWDAKTGAKIATLKGHGERVNAAAFSPDGAQIVTGSWDRTAKVWDAKTGAEVVTFKGHAGRVRSAVFCPTGTRVLTVSEDGKTRVWDAKSGAEAAVLKGYGGRVNVATFSPDGSRIATAVWDGPAEAWGTKVWDAATGAELLVVRGHTEWVDPSFSPDGTRLLTKSLDRTARVWDARTGAPLLTLRHAAPVRSASFSPDGAKLLTSGFDDTTARVWDARTGAEVFALKHGARLNVAAFSPDGSRVVTGSIDGTARVWDAHTGAELLALKCHERGAMGGVLLAVFSPDGTRLLTAGSGDEGARVWDAHVPPDVVSFRGRTGRVHMAALSPDGTRVVVASEDTTARVWDTRTGAELLALKGHVGEVQSAAFSPDGARVVTASWDFRVPLTALERTVRVWDAKTGAELLALKGHTNRVYSAAFGPDGTQIVTASSDRTARVWDAKTGAELLALKGHTDVVQSAVFSPDGERVATASWDRMVRLWDARTGMTLVTLQVPGGAVWAPAFSPDGARVVTACRDRSLRVWDAKTGAQFLILKGHTSAVKSAAFSPDGKRVVTAGDDQTVRVWDAKTGAELLTLQVPGSSMHSAMFNPDGSRIVAAGARPLIGFDPNAPRPVEFPIDAANAIWVWDSRPLNRDFFPEQNEIPFDSRDESAIRRRDVASAWHAEEARGAEKRGDWFAAAFHTGQLARLRPGDALASVRAAQLFTLADRPDRAAAHLVRAALDDPDVGRTPLWGYGAQAAQGRWRIQGGELVQDTRATPAWLWFGSPAWADFDLELEALRVGGAEGFGVGFARSDDRNYLEANFGGGGNRWVSVQAYDDGKYRLASPALQRSIDAGRWYRVKVEARGGQFRVFLDGEKVAEVTDTAHARGRIGVRSFDTVNRFRNIKVTDPKGGVLFEGLPHVPMTGGKGAEEYLALAGTLMNKPDLDGALAALREAARLNPESARIQVELSHILALKRDWPGVAAAAQRAIRLDPKHAGGHNNLGVALREIGQFEESAAACCEAIRLNPRYGRAHRNLGYALYLMGDEEGAVAAYREAIRVEPTLAQTYIDLGTALTGRGDFEGAVAACREAVRLAPREPTAHSGLALALRGQGRLADAVDAFKVAQRLAPNSAAIRGVRRQLPFRVSDN